ncbi:MAG: cobalamin biosynthesis protein CbiG [Desulfovibrio sp.]|nr:MAG: cobalamin biosynthesis protein CbiG [Desulfovibrio sp.]
MAQIAVYALTKQGAALAARLTRALDAVIYLPESLATQYGGQAFSHLLDQVREVFFQHERHVFVCATGIVVRAIAPLLQGKDKDPAVVVLDQDGEHAISLLSGHLGGANALAREVAALTGGRAVITTATDTAGLPAPDLMAQQAGCTIQDMGTVKVVSRALLDGEAVQLHDPQDWLHATQWGRQWAQCFEEIKDLAQWNTARPGIVVTHMADVLGLDTGNILVLRPPCLALGMGCRKEVDPGELVAFVNEVLWKNNLARASVWKMGTVEAKKDDENMTQAATLLGLDLEYFSSEILNTVDVPHPSPGAQKHLGVDSVSEASALLLAGSTELMVPKQATSRATLAIALRQP